MSKRMRSRYIRRLRKAWVFHKPLYDADGYCLRCD